MKKILLLFTILVLPLIGVQAIHQITIYSILIHAGVALGFGLLLLASQQKKGLTHFLSKFLLVGMYFLYLFIAMFEVILFDFSGKGFNNEVYFHIELESLRIAFTQYPIQLSGFVVLVISYVWLINLLLQTKFKKLNQTLVLTCVFLMGLLVSISPLGRFIAGLIEYTSQEKVEMDQAMVQHFVDLNIINSTELTPKLLLDAQTDQPKNLILLYLESFNHGLLNQPQYPELTPHLNRLSSDFQTLDHLSSSYVTIEGIISSQCGTMLPMTAGNNTFLNSGQLMSIMPCMGDVLKQAGYTQYYLGGAAMEFAGKGRFLEEHGYDYIWGSEYWYANGFKPQKGDWGLSDTLLFDNAISTIKDAAKNPPYNVTLLTLGTHLPGYTYESCENYEHSDEPFIDAIHCTDQLVGRFVDRLQAEQLLDDAVLMIVADHGVFPTAKMRELFAGTVEDRRLIAITNYQPPLPNWPISTYDLAPTLLDMLNVKHNAGFLFGQSLLNKTDDRQRFVTRYTDWNDYKMVNNTLGDCSESLKNDWPLNSCYKNKLLGLTNLILENYSVKEVAEPLSCQLNIAAVKITNNNAPDSWELWLNGENHFEHFFHNGYLLNSLKKKSGLFIFGLNDDLSVVKHLYLEHKEDNNEQLHKLFETSTSPFLVVSLAKQNQADAKSNPDYIEVKMYNNSQQQWSKSAAELSINDVDLCLL